MLISGVELDLSGQYRIFIGPRWRWRYVLVDNAQGESVLRAFHSTYHLFGKIPEDAEVFEVPEDERLIEPNDRGF